MTIEADETVLALVIEARKLGNGKIAHFGTSFGANYSAMTELTGAVDCSVVLGGPVKAAFEKGALARLPYGMPDIIANDMGFNRPPSPSEFAQTIGAFSRHALLERATNAPMLVINGADDYFVPHEDTRIFEGRAGTDIHLIEGTGHCAFSKLPNVLALMVPWLAKHIASRWRPAPPVNSRSLLR